MHSISKPLHDRSDLRFRYSEPLIDFRHARPVTSLLRNLPAPVEILDFSRKGKAERSAEMKLRSLFVGFAGLLLIAMLALQWTGPSVNAQDTSGPRLDAVETQVAAQATTIAKQGRDIRRLKDRVTVLEGGSQPTSDTGSSSSSGEGTTVSGVGVMVSDKFTLSSGRYKVSASVEVADFDGFAVHLLGDNGVDELLFNELIEQGGTWTGSTTVEVTGGEYAVQVENTSSPWTLVFEKF
jgi:hypothetical protein